MTELNFSVYGNLNHEKMPTKSNDKTLEYTLSDFQALEMFSGIFGKFFFILSLEECLLLCNKLKVKIPEVFSQSKTISCKLTLLVFKIELASYLYANIADDEDIVGIESEVHMYMSNWVVSKMYNVKGTLIQHQTKYNPFKYATDPTKVISPLGHSSSVKK